MNTVDALKKLYRAMTGQDYPNEPNPTDAEVISDLADALAEMYQDGTTVPELDDLEPGAASAGGDHS